MNDFVIEKLKDFIDTYDDSHRDFKKCNAYLRDLCGNYKREIFLIVSAIKESIPEKLINASKNNLPLDIEINKQVKFLNENLGFSAEISRWAVEGWASALSLKFKKSDDFQKEEETYVRAKEAKNRSITESDYKLAADIFRSISGYKDSRNLAIVCDSIAESIRLMELETEQSYQLAKEAKEKSSNKYDYKHVAKLFRNLSGYKDSNELANICDNLAKTFENKVENKTIDDISTEKKIESKTIDNTSNKFEKKAEYIPQNENKEDESSWIGCICCIFIVIFIIGISS